MKFDGEASGADVSTAEAPSESTRRSHGENDGRRLRQQRMELVGRLTAGAAHDFTNILSSIACNAEYLRRRLGADDVYGQRLEDIKAAIRRAGALIDQALTLTRPQHGREAELLDLNETVRGITALLDRVLGSDLVVRYDFASDLWKIRAEPDRLEKAILELMINARDAMPKEAHLTVATANVELDAESRQSSGDLPSGAYVTLVMSDQGLGPDRGLGLSAVLDSAVREMVEPVACHAEVSQTADRGTEIRVWLPRATDAVPVGASPSGIGGGGIDTVDS